MDLLIASNTVTLDQADKAPASGTPGWATDGDPATGQLATDAPAWHYNMMMSELIAIIKAAGITPSNADWSQVLKAMQTIFSPAQYGVAPYSASLAQLVGGYPKGAIVFDASGNYWQSTAEKNVTVPGAENATWVNFFEGVMTPQQGDIRYLRLSGGNVTGPMDWGNTTAAGTVTQRFWCAGKPADGDATPDGTLTISGGTAGTANKGVMALSTGTFDLTDVRSILVPDVVDFTSQGVLNAKTAEDRYISSVADATASLKRIISLLENADGRAVFWDGAASQVLALVSDLPLADPSRKIQAFIANVSFSNGAGTIVFPTAFAAGEVPIVVLPNVQEYGGSELQSLINISQNGSSAPAITNTGVTLHGMGWNASAGFLYNLTTANTIPVIAIGKM